jgi:hypothetical protein
MARISQAKFATLQLVDKNVEVVRRLAVPPELKNVEQKHEFQRIVSTMPADWFTIGNVPMLVQLCRHIVMARKIDAWIEIDMRDGPTERMSGLLQAQARESKLISQMMTSLRMTPQSVAPSAVSRHQLQQKPSLWSGLGKPKEIEGEAERNGGGFTST